MSESLEPAPAHESTTSKTILLVEDDVDLGDCIVAALEEATPYHVLLASNGIEALQIISSLKPDLFLLDYHLPSMDGLELNERLHQMQELENIPTLFLTAYPFSLALRGRKVISLKKPFDFEELIRVIHELLV
jgi:CheY-like chemotaxis protein